MAVATVHGVAQDPAGAIWNHVAGALAILFLIYITAKGELGNYLQLFFYTPPPPAQPPTSVSPQTVAAGVQQGSSADAASVMKFFQTGNPADLLPIINPSQGLGNIADQLHSLPPPTPASSNDPIGSGMRALLDKWLGPSNAIPPAAPPK